MWGAWIGVLMVMASPVGVFIFEKRMLAQLTGSNGSYAGDLLFNVCGTVPHKKPSAFV
jgi:hypothetical protein